MPERNMRATVRIEYWAVRIVLGYLRLVPEGLARVSGRALAMFWYAVHGRLRRLAVGNIAAARSYPWSRKPRALARANFRHLLDNLVEMARMRECRNGEFKSRVHFTGEEHLERALAKGKGIFFLTAHLGNWELMAAAYRATGRPLSVVAQRIKNPFVDEMVTEWRTSTGIDVIPHRRAAWSIMRALGRGEAVGVLLDQNTLRSEAVFVDFMGRPASANYGLAMLARKTAAPVVPVCAIRLDGWRHRVRFFPEVSCVRTDDVRRDIQENTARFTATLEVMISSNPEQWFWVHNRWKNQPEGVVKTSELERKYST